MRTLLLAGSQEARRLATALQGTPVDLTISLARSDQGTRLGGLPVRIGGWGGTEAFRDWLVRERIDVMIDATHPFAGQMSARAASVSKELGIAALRLLRPEWTPDGSDRWIAVSSASEVAPLVEPGSTVFLATGRRDLADFANLPKCRVIARVKSKPAAPFPFPGGTFTFAPAPFSVAGEIDFFRKEKVDWVVSRNSGGAGSWPKIEAARILGLPVAMIQRPPRTDIPHVATVDAALDWVRTRL